MTHRCRLCTANDIEALRDQLAEELWESRRHGFDHHSFADAGPYWRRVFRELAETAIGRLRQ